MHREIGVLFTCIGLLMLAGCVATQSDVDVVKEKVTYVEDDLYTTSQVIANRLKTIEDETNQKFSGVAEKIEMLSRERAALAEEISILNNEIRKLYGKIDETEYKLTEQLKTEKDISQKAEFEIRRDMESLKKTYTDIITSISSLNTNLSAMQKDLLTVNRSQVTIAESLNKLSTDIAKLEGRSTAMEQKMDTNMQVFLDELTRQESEIVYLKAQIEPPEESTTGTSYTVKSGDSLGGIATHFKTTISEIKKLNNLKSDTIHPGQKLLIP